MASNAIFPEELRQRYGLNFEGDKVVGLFWSWWGGAVIDAAIFSRVNDQDFLRLIVTHESWNKVPPSIDELRHVSSSNLDDLLKMAANAGIESFSVFQPELSFIHYDVWLLVKPRPDAPLTTLFFKNASGFFDSTLQPIYDFIMELLPEFLTPPDVFDDDDIDTLSNTASD